MAKSSQSVQEVIFPIVGIGASAGGMEAFAEILKDLPPDTGMAFVLVQHLDPTHSSFLTEVLVKTTNMPVLEITDGIKVEPNHVYVIPPNYDLDISKGALQLLVRDRTPGRPHMPINYFFRALAGTCEKRAIGVVLSGTANDGTEGLRAIKDAGGFTFVQDPQTAKFGGMPQSAMDSGVVDFSLTLPALAKELVRLGQHLLMVSEKAVPVFESDDRKGIEQVLQFIKRTLGVDFGDYKPGTTRRRLARRMALVKIDNINKYLEFLADNPDEVRALHAELLIHVTAFFRDPEAFIQLKESVFPEIMKQKLPGAPVRIWVAGCSSGEEVYSILIAFLEFLGDRSQRCPVQIFGSDISDKMIEQARVGFYAENLMRDMSPERLSMFFTKVEGGYRIARQVRELCVFVRHDLSRDPPFSRLDLITCRNVLIYFEPTLQKRILSIFHYCLNQPGFLLLGRTESVLAQPQLFNPEDRVNKIFSRLPVSNILRFPPMTPIGVIEKNLGAALAQGPKLSVDVSKIVDTLLLSEYAPCGVLVNSAMDVLQFHGRTSPFLEQPPGQPETNLLRMVRKGLFVELKIAFEKAKKDQKVIRAKHVQIKDNGITRSCELVVRPIRGHSDIKDDLFLVLFEEEKDQVVGKAKGKKFSRSSKKETQEEQSRALRLEQELEATKEYLQSLNLENQKTNDALESANEELVSGNEELQSMNEELETAKEELQSTNEELTTVNDELQHRSQEMGTINNDLINLLNSVEIPIVILDVQRRIRRFTPHARSMMNLLPSDIGRSIDDIKTNVTVDDLDQQIAEVIDTLIIKESEVQDKSGRWHRLQIRPYRTLENKIDGVVLSLVDINILRRAVTNAERARDYAVSIVESIQIPLVVLDHKMKVISANKSFYNTFGESPPATEGKFIYQLGSGQWDIESLKDALNDLFVSNKQFQIVEVEREFPRLGMRIISLAAQLIKFDADVPSMVLLAMQDLTSQKKFEAERSELLRQAEEAKTAAEDANRTKDLFLATLSHELRTPLTSLILQAQILRRGKMDEDKIRRATEVIERSAKEQSKLIEDLLDISRIVTGKLKMERESVDLSQVVRSAVETLKGFAESKSAEIRVDIDASVGTVLGDSVRLQQVVWNLITNAIKFSAKNARVSVTVKAVGENAQIEVSDSGIGIEPEFLPHIFNRFTQVEGSKTRAHGGLGLGLAIVRHIVEMHGGHVVVHSAGKDKGATFTVTLPLFKGDLGVERVTSSRQQMVSLNSESSKHISRHAKLKGLRVLVIDDDVGTREALSELLRQIGVIVKTAASAAEGMRALAEFKPDKIICDIGMPGEDGYTFLRKVRALGPDKGADIPAIALTAFAAEKDRQEALVAGFQMHLAKPVDFDVLADALLKI